MRLQTAMDEGHCGLPIDQLTGLAERLLEVDAELIRVGDPSRDRRRREVIADTVGAEPCVFLKGLHRAERAIAERLIDKDLGRAALGAALTWRRPCHG